MSFEKDYSFTYEYGIRPTIKILNEGFDLAEIDVLRADEYIAASHKVPDIIKRIKGCDFCIMDISENRPDIFWELGFCDAFEKKIFFIQREGDTKESPFNLGTREAYRYDNSVDGLIKMIDELSAKIKKSGTLETIFEERKVQQRELNSLRFDPEVDRLLQNLDISLKTIEVKSIVNNMAKKEIDRMATRVMELKKGKFDLRNSKPPSEIIDYYSQYVSQLDEVGCTYDTISLIEFWTEITNAPKEHEKMYLNANIDAVNAGTHIRRVILIDKTKFEDSNSNKYKEEVMKILSEHKKKLDNLSTAKGYYELKYMLANQDDLENYPNLALWKKREESILFEPLYDKEGRMQITNFYYSKDGTKDRNLLDKERKIKAKRNRFESCWTKSKALVIEDLL